MVHPVARVLDANQTHVAIVDDSLHLALSESQTLSIAVEIKQHFGRLLVAQVRARDERAGVGMNLLSHGRLCQQGWGLILKLSRFTLGLFFGLFVDELAHVGGRSFSGSLRNGTSGRVLLLLKRRQSASALIFTGTHARLALHAAEETARFSSRAELLFLDNGREAIAWDVDHLLQVGPHIHTRTGK